MPRYFRVSMQMSYTASGPPCGFTEQWAKALPGSPSDTNAHQVMQQWATDLIDMRVRCLSSDWRVTGTRISELFPDTGEDGCFWRAEQLGLITCPNVRVGRLGVTDSPWSAVYVKIGVASAPRRQLMRGGPDTWWNGGVFQRDTAIQQLQPFLNFVAPPAANANGAWKFSFSAGSSPCSERARVEPYQRWCVERYASRRIGRPFGLLRGRRSNQAAEATPTP